MTSSGSTARAGVNEPTKVAITMKLAASLRVFIISLLSHLAAQVIRFPMDNNIALCDNTDMSQIGFTTTATRQWLKLSPQIRDRIGKKLETFAATGQGDVKKLKGQAGARLRVGDWRVIFYEEAGVITVVAVGHRREIYD